MTPAEWDQRFAERAFRLIIRLRARGVDEEELLALELGIVRFLAGGGQGSC